ncbi:hypothetical protein RR48_10246 [Papilio machaon]|uniref:Uncharacterized protein n=1 Tax=Papilio machaon TaxID=76193 RepID=A0A194RGD4_PAPMA|nr:hypothetical protein RR48_10246 [Papilio machaon]
MKCGAPWMEAVGRTGAIATLTPIATSTRRPFGLTASHRLGPLANVTRHAPSLRRLGHRHCANCIDPATRDKHSRRNTTSATLAPPPPLHPRAAITPGHPPSCTTPVSLAPAPPHPPSPTPLIYLSILHLIVKALLLGSTLT